MKNKCIIAVAVLFVMIISCMIFVGCGGNKIKEFYDAVTASQEALDKVADKIYQNWYDAIYNKKFLGNINTAIAAALSDSESEINFIDSNELVIKEQYKKLKNSKSWTIIQEVMVAYSEYYEFVINVSGSFNSFSANKENLKKELASSLKKLELEL